jgi:hypothetical protein
LDEQGKKEKLDVTGMIEEINEKTFDDFLTAPDWHTNPRYTQLLKNISYLQLDPTNSETLNNFKEILLDPPGTMQPFGV